MQLKPPLTHSALLPLSVAPAGGLSQAAPVTLGEFLKTHVPGNNKLRPYVKRTGRAAVNCEDTSYIRLLGITRSVVYVENVTSTSDGGMLVPLLNYDSTVLPNPSWKSFASLLKLDDKGNVLWIKQFQDLTPGQFSNYGMRMAFELPNHDILCTASLSLNGSAPYFTDVYRLSASGNIIWKNRLKSDISLNGHPGSYTFYPQSAAEGLNGDVILCGYTFSSTPISNLITVIRFNSAGQKIWDANYGNIDLNFFGSFADGVGVYLKNGQLMVIGRSDGSIGSRQITGIVFLNLDYVTGNLLSKRIFRPEYPDANTSFDKSFGGYYCRTTQLTNGNLLFYGKLRSDFHNFTPGIHHYGVVEFNASGNLENTYTISSYLKTTYADNELLFDSTGKGYLMLFEGNTTPNHVQYFGAFNNYQFQKLRKKRYINTALPGYNGFAPLQDGGYVFIQSHNKDYLMANSQIAFSRMHNSDTSSQCLGIDTSFLRFLPFNVIEDPSFYFLDSNIRNNISILPMSISQTDTTTLNNLQLCVQTNYCDTIKIHGNGNACGYPSSITFTAFKNPACGAIVQWNINSNVIDSMHVLNDTTVTIWPKNINWQGMMYAAVSGGSCYSMSVDSMPVTITGTPAPVNLGPDTVICTGNTLILNAHSGYTSYLWQDGSTDSTFTVTQPGQFYVTTHDACNNRYSDTVNVLLHPPVMLSVGPDRSVCKNDTLHINAPPGFLNYAWQPNYNISSLTAQQVVVNPLVDTNYSIRAELSPGCFGFDTIRIHVNTASVINLGPDKNFCTGDSLVLNAGPGFSSYQWSTGQLLQQITVYNPGQYSIDAVTVQGCHSYDTLQVSAVYPLPVVTLDKNPLLCLGDNRVLNAGAGYINYQWNTGETSATITVNALGLYSVTVTDNHSCKGSDSTNITILAPRPSGFLPADTAICNYGTHQLNPLRSYNTYQWNTGSSNAVISITQPGWYWLQVKDNNNCTGRDSIYVSLKECIKGVYVPTGFTPGNDGRNDKLRPLVFGNILKYEFTVYDRAGQVMFRSVTPNEGWNGMYKGVPLNSAVFVWTCKYQLAGEAEKMQKGTMMLIR